tara:strand:+ start:9340 stop:11799 length:2460 start_codon:yes stop_codon:yes gene_type:complete
MALSFPGSPSVNQIHVDTASGNVYQWNGTVWINFNTQNPKNIKELDNISGSFNGSDTTFALTSGSYPITPVSDAQVIISLGGVVQEAGTDYTTSGSNITFTTAPDAALTFYGLVFGGKVQMSSVDDGSIYGYNLTSGGPNWDTAGNITITGIATIGTSSIVVNGSTNRVTIGSGATVSSDGITAGIVTASVFYGDGSGLEGVVAGIGTTGSINTTGIITATSFSGDGSGLTNIGGALEPLVYSPGIGATGIAADTNIVLTFQKPISANVGIVTIQTEELSYTQAITSPGAGLYGVAGNDRSGAVSGNNVTITVNVGDTLIFSNSVYGDHPLYIRVSDGGASVSEGTLTGEGTATTTWDTFGVTPGTYYYQCSIHPAMIGEIVVQDNVSERFDVATVGSSSTISIDNATLTINPATDLGIGGTNYYVLFPANAFQDTMRTSDSVGISSYYFGTVALTSPAYSLYMTGDNLYGQLGQGDIIKRSSPVQVPGTQWKNIHTDIMQECITAVKTDGTLWAWGLNQNGEYGANDRVDRSSPVQVPGTQWEGGLKTYGTTIAKKTDGTLWTWGNDNNGKHGVNDQGISRSSPTQVPGTEWGVPAVGRDSMYCTKTDGTLWSWGYDYMGALGWTNSSASVPRSSPNQISGTEWKYAVGGYSRAMALKTDGTLWGWGINQTYGGLGLNDVVNRSSPTQVPGTWTDVSSGNYHCLASKGDGYLWTWGINSNGSLGLNNDAYYSSPIQISGTQWTNEFRCTRYGSRAKKTDGTLWAWGLGAYGGEVGNNTSEIAYSSPIQIPGTQWKLGSVGISTYQNSNMQFNAYLKDE